jgi:membrane protein required for colicin V production
MQFTYIDAAGAVIVILSGILAYSRGFTRELLAIGGWILSGFAAFYFAPMLEPLMREIPVVGKFLAENCVISMIAAFSLIVAAGLLVLAVFTPVFSSAVLESALGPVDRVFGFLFGVARGVLLIAVAYLIYINLSGDEVIPALENAASKPIFDESAALLDRYRPEEVPGWFQERIDALMAPCTGEAPAPETPTAPSEGTATDS